MKVDEQTTAKDLKVKQTRNRKVNIDNFDLTRLSLEQKIGLVIKLNTSIAADKKELEAQLSLINGKQS